MSPAPFRVGVLAYNGCYASEIFGVLDLLTMSNLVAREVAAMAPPFEVSVVSPRRRVVASGSVSLGAQPMAPVDLLIVPGFEFVSTQDLDTRFESLQREIDAIRTTADHGTRVASICVGAFLLGEAGLLDDRRATTAWLFADALAARYPGARIDSRALILHDMGITTTAAFSSTSDLAMELIRERCSDEVARITARITLVHDTRTSQAPYIDESIAPASAERFSDEVKRWLDDRADVAYGLGDLAAAFHVSTRTMLRRFQAETGESPLSYLQRVRVHRAKALLETTDLRLSEVMAAVGYLDPGTFRRLFVEHTGVSPTDYRRRFHRPPRQTERKP